MKDLPADIRSIAERLVREPLRSVSELRTALDRYSAHVEHAAGIHAFADRDLALRIAAGCRKLLGDPANHAPPRLRLVQLAVDYLILEDDAESERDSVLGFDDDAIVFDHCAKKLGRTDLILGGTEA